MSGNQRVIWSPQPGPQTAYVHCPVNGGEIFFGGARGGGKTDGSVGRGLLRAIKYGENYSAVFIRKELVQLEAAISRSKEIYSSFGTFNEQKKRWIFKNGAKITFRQVEKDKDAESLQGWNLQEIFVEEIGQYSDLKPLLKLKATLRSTAGVPTAFCATGNPGGPGHGAVKERYVDPAPRGYEIIREKDDFTGMVSERIFIPSRVTDNLLLLQNDPSYISRLASSGSANLVKAWLDGDWNSIDGAFFSEFSVGKHVIADSKIPSHWLRFRAADYGSYYPFAVLWMAYASEEWKSLDGTFVPHGSLVVYRELYGAQPNKTNEGLKMDAEDVGRLIAKHDAGDKITYSVLDPKAFDQDRGPSIAERMARSTKGKVRFRKADNKRTGKNGAIGGWDTLRTRFRGEGDVPTIFIMEGCRHIIRTLPLAQHDPEKPEDLMLPEDHLLDALRYGCMSRPWGAPAPAAASETRDIYSSTFNQLMDDAKKRSKRRKQELV